MMTLAHANYYDLPPKKRHSRMRKEIDMILKNKILPNENKFNCMRILLHTKKMKQLFREYLPMIEHAIKTYRIDALRKKITESIKTSMPNANWIEKYIDDLEECMINQTVFKAPFHKYERAELRKILLTYTT
tara:strand:- start:3928 stop:4323 length:396 start_codon:yes stop_codon:yes gene_type:complete